MGIVPIHEFEQFYVISDLHIGGEQGFQIFQQGPLLAGLIDWLSQPSITRKIGLCINGDTVDFLAEPGATYFDPHGANRKLDRMFQDPGFLPVWDALRRFIACKGRRLIFTLGNHDLELAMPWVQEHLLRFLSQGSDEARGRVTFSFEGTGYSCTVGEKSVLCLHGNEFDPWNLTDYEKLRRIGRDITYGRSVEPWTPNAGTKLVIDVMNEIKRQYCFVDVLKPEVEAVLPILWVLGEATRSRLNRVVAVSRRLSWDSLRKAVGFLSPGEAPTSGHMDLTEDSDGFSYRPPFDAPEPDQDKLLDWAEREFKAGTDPLSLTEPSNGQLGMSGAIWDRVRGLSQHEQSWKALKDLSGDSTFDLNRTDETFNRADRLVDPSVDYLITGHTHQARSLHRKVGQYFNSGTWATLMHLTPAQLQSAETFKAIFQRLASASNLTSLGDLVQWRPTVVSVIKDKAGTTAKLSNIVNQNNQVVFQPVEK